MSLLVVAQLTRRRPFGRPLYTVYLQGAETPSGGLLAGLIDAARGAALGAVEVAAQGDSLAGPDGFDGPAVA